jgi:hypothetical protein
MFGDDEDIRSDRDLADDYREGMERQDRLIKTMQAELDRQYAEIVRLRERLSEICDLAAWHYDQDADPANTSPEDTTAHVNGLIVKLCEDASGPRENKSSECDYCGEQFDDDSDGHLDADTGLAFCSSPCEMHYAIEVGMPEEYTFC